MEPTGVDLIVVPGARKSGTTTLYRLLLQHDAIQGLRTSDGSNLKEPNFFALEPEIVGQNLTWYRSLLRDGSAKYYLDASQHYFVSPDTPDLFDRYVECVKYIILLRDPVERLFSDYLHQRAKVSPSERRSFEEIIESITENLDLGIGAAEEKEIRRGHQQSTLDLDAGEHLLERLPFQARFQDPLITHRYLQNSLYSEHASRFEDSRHETLVVGLEELLADPAQAISRIFDFLGLAPEGVSLPHHNKTKLPSSAGRLYLRFTQSLRRFEPIDAFLDSALLNSEWIESVKKLVRPQQKSRKEIEEQTDEKVFAQAEELLKKEYQHWRSTRPGLAEHWK
jgi:hypothetical protein